MHAIRLLAKATLHFISILLFAAALSCSFAAYAVTAEQGSRAESPHFEVVPLTDAQQKLTSLPMHSSILRDPEGNASFADVLDATFTPVQSMADLQLAYTQSPVWLRTAIHNNTDAEQHFFLRFDNPSLGHVILHVVHPESSLTVSPQVMQQHPVFMQSGLYVPLRDRAYVTRLSSFPLTFAPDQTLLLYSRVESPASKSLGFALLDEFDHRNTAYRHSFWLTAYFGMICALALYNLLLFSGLRDKVFALYALFAVSFGIAGLSFNGLGNLLFWDNTPIDAYRVVAVGYTLSAFIGTLFTQQFLHTQVVSPSWHRYLNTLAALAALGVAGAILLPPALALPLMDLVGLTVCLSLLSCGIYCVFKGVAGARIFVLAWSVLLIGASAFALRNLGILPSNTFTMYGLQFGSALEMLLLSFGLVARFHKLKRQKEIAQSRMLRTLKLQEQELELKVAQRTQELENMASTDMLTGLLNRNGMARFLSDMLQRSRRAEDTHAGRTQVTLYMLDLDDFKPVNDIYGHEAGDVVLKEVAKRLRQTARADDGIARFGGDEFIIISEDSLKDARQHEEGITAFIQRLQEVIRHPVMLPDGSEVCVHASIGHATNSGRANIDQMLRNADMAMYHAKRQKAVS